MKIFVAAIEISSQNPVGSYLRLRIYSKIKNCLVGFVGVLLQLTYLVVRPDWISRQQVIDLCYKRAPGQGTAYRLNIGTGSKKASRDILYTT